jgi:hypothetical protein
MRSSSAARQLVARAPLAAVLIVLLPNVTAAQDPVMSFDQLNTRLKVGDTVWVTDAQGREIKGKIREFTPSALTIDDGGLNTMQVDAVRVVERRSSRPVKKGALWGLAIGGALGLAVVIDGSDNSECADDCGTWALMAPVVVGLGVGAGAGIGAMIPGKKRVVYRAPGASGSARLSIGPVITPRMKGVAVSLSF